MPTLRALSQTIVFFTVIKLMQYIFQIEDREMPIKNPGSLPHESPLVGQKMAGKLQIDSGSSLARHVMGMVLELSEC